MRARMILLVAAAALSVVVWATPAGAGGTNNIVVVAVVNGTPTGSLEVTRTCTGAPGNATSAPFTTSTNPAIAAGGFAALGDSCTVTATQSDGMVVTFGCVVGPPADAVGMACGAGGDSVTNVTNRSATATITVTFTTPTAAEAPAAVVAAPTTTG